MVKLLYAAIVLHKKRTFANGNTFRRNVRKKTFFFMKSLLNASQLAQI